VKNIKHKHEASGEKAGLSRGRDSSRFGGVRKQKTKNMGKLKMVLMAGLLAVAATRAQASLFDITFTSNDGTTTANATVYADSLGGGQYEATSGAITVSSPYFLPAVYSLVPNPNYPSSTAALISQSGFFIYDDQVNSGSNPFLTNPGLLFLGPDGGNIELNLFSNGPSFPVPGGTYQLYDNRGANLFGDATIALDSANEHLAPVPEASTVFAGAMMLLPFGLSAARIMRKNRMA
jgi:hypothetical protein